MSLNGEFTEGSAFYSPKEETEYQSPSSHSSGPDLTVLDRGQSKTLFGIQFTDLNYQIPIIKRKFRRCRVITERSTLTAIRDISGYFLRGKVTAILGPSGSGKTTLLNVLAGRASAKSITGSKVSGTVSIDSIPIDPVKERRRVAYVMSEDAMYGTLTPEEVLKFSVNVRNGKTPEITNSKVDNVLASLGLLHCRRTYIGDELTKGISSGERKRTSVGIDVVYDPLNIFLDEPTTGLDSYRAMLLIKFLKRIAQEQDRCVVCTIHQPASETFALFDEVLLLSNGCSVYQGKVTEATDYFRSAGFECPANYNPADFMMNMIQTSCESAIESLRTRWAERQERNKIEIDSARAVAKASAHQLSKILVGSTVNQLRELLSREIIVMFRDKRFLGIRILVPVLLALLTSFIMFQAGKSGITQSHVAALTNVAIGTMMSAAQPLVLSFPLEKPIFIREHSSGAYGTVPFFLVKTAVEIPITAFQVILVLIIDYWISGLVGNFGLIYLGAFLNCVASAGIALALGAFAATPRTAVELMPLTFMPQFLFAGFWVRITTIPIVLQWIQWIVPLK